MIQDFDEKELILAIASQYFIVGPLELEDLLQSGYVAYLEAVKNFDPKLADGDRLTKKYVTKYIIGEIQKLVQGDHKHRTNKEEYYEDSIIDPTKNPVDLLGDEELARVIESLPILDKREQKILYDSYLADRVKSNIELADTFGISNTRIGQIKEKAFFKLRKELFKDEI